MPEPTETPETIQWMSIEQVESKLERLDSRELEQTFKRVRDQVADDIIRHRNEEAADFADAKHQIVGYEVTR